MALNTAAIRALLEPGLYAVEGDYESKPAQWNKIFKTRKSTKQVEQKAQMRFLGLPALKAEGGSITFDNQSGQRSVWNARSVEVAIGFAVTRLSIDDNLYQEDFSTNALEMSKSFAQYKETFAANVVNNGTTYDATVGGDGVALFSTAHPYDGGTWANRFSTDLDLNEASLLQGCLNIRSDFKNEAGLKINALPEMLVVPVALIPVAERIVKSEYRPGTANNDINAIRSMPGGIKEYMPWDYLTSTRAWFLTTNIDGFIMFERKKFETNMWTDDVTQNLLVSGYERYVPVNHDPRSCYGSFASA